MKKLDPEVKKLREDIRKLKKILKESYDFHEYCGWGDTWERSCAMEVKLPQRMEKLINENSVGG